MNRNRTRGHNFERMVVTILNESKDQNIIAQRFGGPGQPDILYHVDKDWSRDEWGLVECKSTTRASQMSKKGKEIKHPIRIRRKQLQNHVDWCRFFGFVPTVYVVCKFPKNVILWIKVDKPFYDAGDIVVYYDSVTETLPLDCTILER